MLSLLRWTIAFSLLGYASIMVYGRVKQKRTRVALPPGPEGEPLIGHLRIIPEVHPEYQYTKWGKEFGLYHQDLLEVTRWMTVLHRHGYPLFQRSRPINDCVEQCRSCS